MNDFANRVTELAVQIQQIPAPTFAEGNGLSSCARCLPRRGLADVSIDEVGNVAGRLPGVGR
jgi:tripeptide aminopeptidase